jgi:hypothetical protein
MSGGQLTILVAWGLVLLIGYNARRRYPPQQPVRRLINAMVMGVSIIAVPTLMTLVIAGTRLFSPL